MRKVSVFAACAALGVMPAAALAQDVNSPASGQDAAVEGDAGVEKILNDEGIIWSQESNGDYRLEYDMEGNRQQIAWITPTPETIGTQQVRFVFSYAAEVEPGVPLTAEQANALLEENGNYILGTWLRLPSRVVFQIPVDANASSEELLDVLSIVLDTADTVEKDVFGQDLW